MRAFGTSIGKKARFRKAPDVEHLHGA
ncbi:MAG: hypothetical protein RI997_946, partial [Pseudomonadota bacterium]